MKNQGQGTPMQLSLAKLNVNTIDSTSGIFIGINNTIGWSSHSKSNSGFGSSSDEESRNNINIVIDNDLIDSPIDDRDFFVGYDSSSNRSPGQSMDIIFEQINVNALDTNATISMGNNAQSAWDAHSKNNSGSGTFYGNTHNSNNTNIVMDTDMIDSPINDQDFKPVLTTKKE